jgi:hypothetical protein
MRIQILLVTFDSFPDPDPTFHLDPDPACHFDLDPDPDYHFDADPDLDPVYHRDTDSDPDPTFQFDAARIRKTGNDVRFRTSTSVINLHANNPLKI